MIEGSQGGVSLNRGNEEEVETCLMLFGFCQTPDIIDRTRD
jgi:hypothetical protein